MKKILLAIALLTSTAIMAESAYVSDELEIMVRSGKSSGHRIIATLKSGQKNQMSLSVIRPLVTLALNSVHHVKAGYYQGYYVKLLPLNHA